MFQYPELLNSEATGFGNTSLYFNKERVGQKHMVIFLIAAVVLLCLMVFEGQIIKLWGMIFKSTKQEMIEAPDLYEDINLEQLCKEYKLQRVER